MANPYVSKVVLGNETLIDLTADTITAANLKSGVTAHDSSGTLITGTAAITVSDKKLIMPLGLITLPGVNPPPVIVTGTFNFSPEEASEQTVTLAYSGNGYPIACAIVLDSGVYTASYTDTIAKYSIAQYFMTKTYITTAPTYTTSGDANMGAVATVYKSSDTTAATLTRTSKANTNTFSSSAAAASTTTCVRFKNKTTLSIYAGASSGTSRYGFFNGLAYRYWVIYSS